jgi:hypothetical protein
MVNLPTDWQISLYSGFPSSERRRQAMTFGPCFAGMKAA